MPSPALFVTAIAAASLAAAPVRADDRDTVLEILGAADTALSELGSIAYTARYTRRDMEPGQAEPEPDTVDGQVWLARHHRNDRLGWKVASITWMKHATVRHEGVYAHWAYDGRRAILIHPERTRAQIVTGEGGQSIVADFFRGNLLPTPFRATRDWKTPQREPFAALAGNAAEIEMLGNELIGGVACVSIRIVHAAAPDGMVTQSEERWAFAVEDHLPRAMSRRWTFDRTRTVETLTITGARINPWMDDAVFSPAIPEGYEVHSDEEPAVAVEVTAPAANAFAGTRKIPGTPQKRYIDGGQAGAAVGDPAPGFELVDGLGATRSVAEFRGSVVLVDFWGTWCPPCRQAMPGLQQMHEQLADRGLVVLAVSCNERPGTDVPAFLRERGYTYPVLLEGDAVARRYGVQGFPTVVVLDREGRILRRETGYSTEKQAAMAVFIERALADEP